MTTSTLAPTIAEARRLLPELIAGLLADEPFEDVIRRGLERTGGGSVRATDLTMHWTSRAWDDNTVGDFETRRYEIAVAACKATTRR